MAYSTPITGTMADATRAITLMPPMITTASNTASTAPLAAGGMAKDSSSPDAKLLLCGMLPEPKVLITVATAKNTASHFMFRPRSM